jgi:uracil phosphoribosyltransferase
MNFQVSEIEHRYGSRTHVLADPCLASWLAKLCAPQTQQPEINNLVEFLYTNLLKIVVNAEFPQKAVRMATRMTAQHPEAPLITDILDTESRTVCVNLARAGTYPSHICYHLLNQFLNPQLIRQDHILASRQTDESEKVQGTLLGGVKIGGDIEGSIVLLPDPMGATGHTIISALDHYKRSVQGQARMFVALHLIVTPEYLRNVQAAHPDLKIYALRLDRGLSSAEVLKSVPGTYWDQEKGLNEKHYIVPGGGGFGEILNNSFV